MIEKNNSSADTGDDPTILPHSSEGRKYYDKIKSLGTNYYPFLKYDCDNLELQTALPILKMTGAGQFNILIMDNDQITFEDLVRENSKVLFVNIDSEGRISIAVNELEGEWAILVSDYLKYQEQHDR